MKSLSLAKPHLIVMVGMPGAGKSFFVERFSDTFGAPLISWKAIRHELFNEPVYNKDEDAIIERVATHMLDELLKTGATILYEGSVQSQVQRQTIERAAKQAGYETIFLWVQIDEATARVRAAKNGLTPAQFERYLTVFTPPRNSRNLVVISGKHTYASQLKIVLTRLSDARGREAPAVPQRPTNRPVIIR